jgi:hypothetical protein
MRLDIRSLLFLVVLLLSAGLIRAQQTETGGQICVRGFEDRNGNGAREGGEPLLTRGLSATLQDAQGVIIDSRLLENSSLSASGLICFQQLAAGQYTVSVTSADYTATTESAITTNVSASGQPPILDFGAQVVAAPTPAASSSVQIGGLEVEQAQLTRIVLSALGALGAIAGMIVLGLFVWLIAFRNRRAPAPTKTLTTTGSTPVVK